MALIDQPYKVLILGASGGIGTALTAMFRGDPACLKLTALSRRDDGVDLTREGSVQAAVEKLSHDEFDLIINAAGALEIDGKGPEKNFQEIDPDIMAKAFAINATGSALAYKHFLPLLRTQGPACFVTLSARVGSIGDNDLGGWVSYRASKAALNQITKCAAIAFSRKNKDAVIVSLHPGTIETDLTRKYAKGRYTASPEECATTLLQVIERLIPAQTGGFFDYAGKEIGW